MKKLFSIMAFAYFVVCGTQLFAAIQPKKSSKSGYFGSLALTGAGAGGTVFSMIKGLRHYNYIKNMSIIASENALFQEKIALEHSLQSAQTPQAIQKVGEALRELLSKSISCYRKDHCNFGYKSVAEILWYLRTAKLKLFGYCVLGLGSLAATVYGARLLYKTYQTRKKKA